MEKKFEIIPIEDYGVVVDKESPVTGRDWFYNYESKMDGRANSTSFVDSGASEHSWKVIATINKRIDDIPLIQLSKWESEFNRVFPKVYVIKVSNIDAYHNLKDGFMEGYKAAGGYSRIDIENAYNHGYTECEEHIEQDSDVYFKSLQPKLPKSVVLEMEVYFRSAINTNDVTLLPNTTLPDKRLEDFYGDRLFSRLKITNPSTNIIIPKEILW